MLADIDKQAQRGAIDMPVSGNDMTGNANYKLVSFRCIDHRGDKRAVAIRVPITATVANINALRIALGGASNANFYETTISDVYGGIPSASVAIDAVFANTDSAVNVLFKSLTTLEAKPFEIPAPIGAMVLEGEVVDLTNGALLEVTDAVEALLGAIEWSPVQARFSERRNTNTATSF